MSIALSAMNGSRPADDLEHHRAERVDVGAVIDVLAARLLGRHVAGRADQRCRCASCDAARRASRHRSFAMPKSSSLTIVRPPRTADEEHVVGLEIAMDDAASRARPRARRDLVEDLDRLVERQRPRSSRSREALALQPLHHEVAAAVGQRAEREHVDDVGVADLVDRARLLDEALDRRRDRCRAPRCSTLIAARLPITGWIAAYTAPMPPSPIFCSTRYSPTMDARDEIRSRWRASSVRLDRHAMRRARGAIGMPPVGGATVASSPTRERPAILRAGRHRVGPLWLHLRQRRIIPHSQDNKDLRRSRTFAGGVIAVGT